MNTELFNFDPFMLFYTLLPFFDDNDKISFTQIDKFFIIESKDIRKNILEKRRNETILYWSKAKQNIINYGLRFVRLRCSQRAALKGRLYLRTYYLKKNKDK